MSLFREAVQKCARLHGVKDMANCCIDCKFNNNMPCREWKRYESTSNWFKRAIGWD